MIDWLIHSNAGLLTRVAIGIAIFTALAIADRRRNGIDATRWREYGVLVVSVAAALLYGTINDQITVTISPEYFLYGKGLATAVGDPPRSAIALRWAVAKVGWGATWSVGLLIGVALLLANNPHRRWPRLPYRHLLKRLFVIFALAVLAGIGGGLLGWNGALNACSSTLHQIAMENLFRPQCFIAVWGIHLGGYVGGLIGTIAAILSTVRERIALSREQHAFSSAEPHGP